MQQRQRSTMRETEFKEFEPRLKYDWFHLILYSMFKVLSRFSNEPVFSGFEMRLKLIKFGLISLKRDERYHPHW